MNLLPSIRAGTLGVFCLCLPLSLAAQDDPRVQEVVRLAGAERWTEALKTAQSIDEPASRVLALCNLAKQQVAADELGAAKQTLAPLATLTGEISSAFMRLKAIGFLGAIQIEAGDALAGQQTFARAHREARGESDARGVLGALVDIAERRYRMGDLNGGRETYAVAMALADRLEASQERVALCIHIDKSTQKFGDVVGRKHALVAAATHARGMADIEVTFKVLLTIGEKQLSLDDQHGFVETMAIARQRARAIHDGHVRSRLIMIVAERQQVAGHESEARKTLRDLDGHHTMLVDFAKKPEFTAEIQANADTILAYALLQVEVDDRDLGWSFLKQAVLSMRVKRQEILQRAHTGFIRHRDWPRALEAVVLLARFDPENHVHRLDRIWRGSLAAADFGTAELIALQYSDLRVYFDRRLEFTGHLAQAGRAAMALACLSIAEKLIWAIEAEDDKMLAADPTQTLGTWVEPYPDLVRRARCVQSCIRLGLEDAASRAVRAAVVRAQSKRDCGARIDALLALADTFHDLELSGQRPICWAAALTLASAARQRDVMMVRIADSQAFSGALVEALHTIEQIGGDKRRERCRMRLFERSIGEIGSAAAGDVPVGHRLQIARSIEDQDRRFDAFLALTTYYTGLARSALALEDRVTARRAATDATAWLTSTFKPAAAQAARAAVTLDAVASIWRELGEDERAAALMR